MKSFFITGTDTDVGKTRKLKIKQKL